jgi:hypothetical protein
MAAQSEFPTFANEKTTSCSLYKIKNTMKKLPQIVYRLANEFLKLKMVKNIYF